MTCLFMLYDEPFSVLFSFKCLSFIRGRADTAHLHLWALCRIDVVYFQLGLCFAYVLKRC